MQPRESSPSIETDADRALPINVCLVALGALPVVDPAVQRPFGGTETRAWQFAKGFAASSAARASLVVRSSRSREPFQRDRVQVVPRHERLFALYESVGQFVEKSPRFPGVRIRRWSPRLFWQLPALALHRTFVRRPSDPRMPDPFFLRLECDVFAPFGVQSSSATVIASAHATQRPAVLILGSDADLDERYQPASTYISPYGDRGDVCHHILMQADEIVAQTSHQQQLLKERFGRNSTLVQNPIDVAEWDSRLKQPSTQEETGGLKRYVLWIGRAESVHKRPAVCLELARSLPHADFLMVLNPRDPDVERQIHDQAPPNVRIVPHVPFERIAALFAHAAALVNTSSLEGLPNVFLQAALSRVPIASLNVGEDLLTQIPGGHCARGSIPSLCEYLERVWKGVGPDAASLDAGRNAVIENHSLERQVSRLNAVLRSVITRTSTTERGD